MVINHSSLLHDEASAVLQRSLGWTEDTLYPAILRTSSLLHDEALAVLYGENTFGYECYYKHSFQPHGLVWPNPDMTRVKRIQLDFPTGLKTDLIPSLLDHVASFHCLLDTLTLQIGWPEFVREDNVIDKRGELQIGLRLLKIRHLIKIILRSFHFPDGECLQGLVDAVSEDRSWTKTTPASQKTAHLPGLPACDEFKWTWEMRPENRCNVP